MIFTLDLIFLLATITSNDRVDMKKEKIEYITEGIGIMYVWGKGIDGQLGIKKYDMMSE